MSETLEQTVEAFARSLRAGGCRERTVEQWTSTVLRVGRVQGSDPRWWGRAEVEAYLARPGWSANTRLTYFKALSRWFTWLLDSDRITVHPMARMRRPPTPRGVPHPIDTDLLARAVATATGDLRAWLILGAYEGLRLSEIAAFRGEQLQGDRLSVVGKGGVEAVLPAHPLVVELARHYPARGYWFLPAAPSRRHPHRAPESITAAVRRHIEALGGQATPHALRHWFGTEALEASGGNLRVTQQLMRHASSALTERYTLVRTDRLAATVRGLPDVVGSAS